MTKPYPARSMNQHRHSFSALGLLATVPCVALSLGCSKAPAAAEEGPVSSTPQALAGQDGARRVDTAGTVLNAYAAVDPGAGDITAGDVSLTLDDVDNLALDVDGDGSSEALAAGDLLLVIQMQGASIDETDSASYGEVTALGSAGLYEFVTVGDIAGDTISLDAHCAGGLRNSYSALGRTQVVRVPEYASLRVDSGASVVAAPWNGSVGGIVALDVQGETTLAGTGRIDVSGLGFRGGSFVGDNLSRPAGTATDGYAYTVAADGGEKGESIAGYQDDLAAGRYGRGAPANGGGGGNSHNAGGGGGSNARIAGALWTGLGVMDPAYSAIWLLEPGITALADSPGGGRGGYSFSNADQDPSILGPDESAWGGDGRKVVGGLGGHPLDPEATTRVFPGGGGGAGDGNDGVDISGGAGGGIVFLFSSTVSGQGEILASGAASGDADTRPNDAPGGGGGGGTVIVQTTSLGNVTINAEGGKGGDQRFPAPFTSAETEGPGGGGGGGYVVVVGTTATPSVAGGANGTTNSPPFGDFGPNGATSGGSGSASSLTDAVFPFCVGSLSVTLTDGLDNVPTSTETIYTLTVTSNAAATLTALDVTLPEALPDPDGFTLTGWTCSTPSTTDVDADTCGALTGTGAAASLASLAPGATAIYTITGTVDAAPGTTLTTQGAVTVGTTDFAATDSTTVTDGALPAITAPTAGVTTPEDIAYVFSADDGDAGTTDTPIAFTVPGPTSQSVTVTLTVSDVGDDGNGTLTLGSVLGLTFTEGDGSDDLTMTFTGTPAAVNAALEGLSFVPTPNYNGTDTTVSVSITRSTGGAVQADIPIEVTPVNDPPVAVDDAVNTLPGGGVLNVLGNDTDIDGDTLTVSEVSTPARGTVTINSDGTLTYAATPGATGTDTFTYTIADGNGGTDQGSVLIELGGGADSDGDGLSDDFEEAIGSDPNDADSDDDGAIDGIEPNAGADSDGDGLIDVLDPDSDNDGLLDGTELGQDCDDPATDAAAGFCVADADGGATTTDPSNPDTDGGGASDGSEDFNLNGQLDAADGETDPTAGNGADDGGLTDSDGDGLSDEMEATLGSNPNDADSDDDGTPDGLEPNPSLDMDGDGSIDILDPDSDGDGLFDGTEMGLDCSNAATDSAAKACIPDGDKGTTTTSPLNSDTDGGTIPDGDEDTDHDGVLDPNETDPNDGTDDLCAIDADCGSTPSGRICSDGSPRVCIDGCRGTNGNGCPSGYSCTSTDATAGVCEETVVGAGGAGGAAGAAGSAGTTGTAAAAGSAGSAGAALSSGAGGAPSVAGAAGEAGTPSTAGSAGEAGAPAAAGTTAEAGAPAEGSGGEAGSAEPPAPAEEFEDSLEGGGCSCRVAAPAPRTGLWAGLGLAFAFLGRRKRRQIASNTR